VQRAEREVLLSRVRGDARRVAAHFGLEYRAIEAERRGVKSRYGACYQDGLIKIRLQHAKTGEQLKYSSLIDTLCHELAHLEHFNHGKEFKRLYLRILRWARQEGIYRPRARGIVAPVVREVPIEVATVRVLSSQAPRSRVGESRREAQGRQLSLF